MGYTRNTQQSMLTVTTSLNDFAVIAAEARAQVQLFAEKENPNQEIVWGEADNLEGFCFYSSLLFLELCKKLEAHHSRMVCGYFGKGTRKRLPTNHFWNQVRVGRKWRVVDITATQFFPVSQSPVDKATGVWLPTKEEEQTWYKPRYVGYRALEFGENHWDECQNPLYPKENYSHIEKLIDRSLKKLERINKGTIKC